MYTVILYDPANVRQRNIFMCDTVEEANMCAQFYMRNRTEYNTIIYIVPSFDNDAYDKDSVENCVKKCRIEDEEDSKWNSMTSHEPSERTKAEVRNALKILNDYING